MSGFVKISEAASMAIHALVIIAANPGRMLSSKEIAATFHLSATHLSKVMQRLVKAGLATSSRGPSGGFELGQAADQITLMDIYQAIEGPPEDQGCLLGRHGCQGERCLLGHVIEKVNREIGDALSQTSLAELTRSFLIRSGNMS